MRGASSRRRRWISAAACRNRCAAKARGCRTGHPRDDDRVQDGGDPRADAARDRDPARPGVRPGCGERAIVQSPGLLLAYEETGYDNTQPGRLPDLLPHVSVKRIVDWGADAVKILIYYTPFDTAPTNDIKHAFIERVGAECEDNQIPFFLEFVGYDPKGGDEKGLEFAKLKPEVVIGAWRSLRSLNIKWMC